MQQAAQFRVVASAKVIARHWSYAVGIADEDGKEHKGDVHYYAISSHAVFTYII